MPFLPAFVMGMKAYLSPVWGMKTCLFLMLAIYPAFAAVPMAKFHVMPPTEAFAIGRNEMCTIHGPTDNPIMTVYVYLSNVTLFGTDDEFASVPTSCCGHIGGSLPASGMNFDVFGSIESIDTTQTIENAIDSWNGNLGLPSLAKADQIFSAPAFATDGETTLSFGAIGPEELQSAVGVVRIVISGGTITEWDMVINIETYDIGDAAVNSALIDAWQLLGHEFGHVFGLDDLYADSCAESAMYGFISTGDTTKREIDSVSLDCAAELYGLDPAAANANRSGIVHSIGMFMVVVALIGT